MLDQQDAINQQGDAENNEAKEASRGEEGLLE